MKTLFRIGLALLFSLLIVGSISIVRIDSGSFSLQPFSQQSLGEESSLTEECFHRIDLESLESCKKLALQNRSSVEIWNQLGCIYYGLENYKEAYLSFKYATSVQSDYVTAWANTCAALNQLQDYEQALSACNRSLELSSDSETAIDEKVSAWHNKAIVLYFLGRYQESLDALDETLAIKPDDLEANLNRRLVLHALAHVKELGENDLML
ncbi:MAG: tetratricopeptide repeat protein [Cyanobacteria bacterium P01_H01_bin.58]